MVAMVALLVYAFAPLVHGFIHPDHEIRDALAAYDDGKTAQHQKSPADHDDQDCGLFKLYASHGAGATLPEAEWQRVAAR